MSCDFLRQHDKSAGLMRARLMNHMATKFGASWQTQDKEAIAGRLFSIVQTECIVRRPFHSRCCHCLSHAFAGAAAVAAVAHRQPAHRHARANAHCGRAHARCGRATAQNAGARSPRARSSVGALQRGVWRPAATGNLTDPLLRLVLCPIFANSNLSIRQILEFSRCNGLKR